MQKWILFGTYKVSLEEELKSCAYYLWSLYTLVLIVLMVVH